MVRSEAVTLPADPTIAYKRAGFFTSTGDVAYVGITHYLAGAKPESTLAIVTFSLPNRALTFTREGGRYRAAYDVVLDFRRDTSSLKRIVAHEEVRVGSFRETVRDEESVIFQQFVLLPPGAATLEITTRDAGSTRSGAAGATLQIPRFDPGSIASPLPVLRARARRSRAATPDVVVSPRATGVLGRDSILEFLVEAYEGPLQSSSTPLQINVGDEGGRRVLVDTVTLTDGARAPQSDSAAAPVRSSGGVRSGHVRLPVSRMGLGVLSLGVSDLAPPAARAPAALSLEGVETRFVVSISEGLTVSSFDEMLSYLRHFTTSERLKDLRETAPEERSRAWATFLRQTDPVEATPTNEALRDYLRRVGESNVRFAEEGSTGWLTDRGMIYSAFGEPDSAVESANGDPAARTRVLSWEYTRYRVRFVFVEQATHGHWRLTPASETEYQALMRRLSR